MLSGKQEVRVRSDVNYYTARKLEEHGRKADVTAARFTVEGMTEAISRDWNRGSEN